MIAINPSRDVGNMCINGGNIIDLERSQAGSGIAAWEYQHASRQVAAHLHLLFEGDARTHLLIIEEAWVKVYRMLIDGHAPGLGLLQWRLDPGP